ncbi:MAG: hypothetical protein K0R55_3459 [Sporomusa sp.]|nr:hypothetical protein [Sporomusa sp.]
MGNIAGDMVVHRDIGISDGVAALSIWAVLTFIVEYVSLKSPLVRIALDGEPTIVIKRGQIMQKELRSHRLNMDDLSMMLRIKNIFSIQDVDYAILEPNGELTVLKKPQLDGVTRQDIKIDSPVRLYLPTELIVDGRLVEKNLTETHLTKEWLLQELNKAGYLSYDDVFFAELQSDGTLYIERNKLS